MRRIEILFSAWRIPIPFAFAKHLQLSRIVADSLSERQGKNGALVLQFCAKTLVAFSRRDMAFGGLQ